MCTGAEQVRIASAAIGRDIEVREAATSAEAVNVRFPDGAPPGSPTPSRRASP